MMASKGLDTGAAKPVKPSARPKAAPRAVPAETVPGTLPPTLDATPEVVVPTAVVEPAPPSAAIVAAPVVTPEPPEAAIAAASTRKDSIMEATLKTATDKTQAMFADANDRAKAALEKGAKLIEDLNDFSKGNVEAIVESGKIAAKGAEEVARYTTDYAKASVEKANAAAKTFAAVKSPTELFKLQGDYAKEAMDSLVAESAKFTESYLKLLGEIAQPLSNRVALAAEKIKITA